MDVLDVMAIARAAMRVVIAQHGLLVALRLLVDVASEAPPVVPTVPTLAPRPKRHRGSRR